ncbi:MAG: PAS domain S-box protein [Chloroflexi bacterium]|nr:PAS domain S-box protein [Chloroflexota bacterium]
MSEPSALRDPEGRISGAITVLTDVTQQRKLLRDLAASEARLRTLYEAVACGVLVWDMRGTAIDVNAAGQEILGLTLDQIRGRTAEALWQTLREDGSALPEAERPHVIALRTGRPVRHATVPVVLRNGERCWLQVEAVPVLGEEGEPVQVVSSFLDITEHKRVEQERASLNEQLQRSLQELLALHEAGQVLGASLEPEEVASRVLEVAARISGLEVGTISLVQRGTTLRAWQTTGAVETFRTAQRSPAARKARRAALQEASPTYYHLDPAARRTEVLAGWCFPLRTHDRAIGVLEVCGPEAAACRAPVDVLGSLANQAASVLENARLYREAAEREQRLQELVKRLLLAQEAERRRVAYDIHDGLAQVVTGAQLSLETLAAHYHPRSPRARQELERALELARRAVKEARRVIADLRPTALDQFGLATALRVEVEALQAEGWEITFDDRLGGARLASTLEAALFRVAQEALMNVRRHAQTTRVHVALHCQDNTVRLEVRDWGRGFQPSRPSTTSGPGERVGLPSMHERARLLGGRCTVRSRPGRGTKVVVEAPVPPLASREGGDER